MKLKQIFTTLLLWVSPLGGSFISLKVLDDWTEGFSGFEINVGQILNTKGTYANEVLVRATLPGYSIFITKKGVSYVLYRESKPQVLIYSRIDVELLNADIKKENIECGDPLKGYKNYYFPFSEGIVGVVSYGMVRIKNIYRGIDWVWEYRGNRVHHHFEVKPFGNTSEVKLKVIGAGVEISDNGKKLVLSTPLGAIVDGDIVAYEVVKGSNVVKEVNACYKRREDEVIYIDVNRFSSGNTLIIDPPLSLLWSTYYGGADNDRGLSITSDGFGNVFLTGRTNSLNFPTYNPGGGSYYQGTYAGWTDAFILKFSHSGERLWATYYGGSNSDFVYSITSDIFGNIILTGMTNSTDFPTYNPGGGAYYQGTNAGASDLFILKLNNLGERLWATYYGGGGSDAGCSVTADGFGNMYVTGWTNSTDFPVLNPGGNAYYQGNNGGVYDAFVLKFNNTGQRLWATYYGGGGVDAGWSITSDDLGNVFLIGHTRSMNFPTYNPGGGAYYQGAHGGGTYDAFILKFNNSGERMWATYYGGNGDESAYSTTTDGFGNVFVTGWTNSTNFPVFNPGGSAYFQGANGGAYDAFFLKFNNVGERLWATYYGGNGDDYGYSVSSYGSRFVLSTGWTYSTNFPTYNPGGGAYFQGTNGGFYDAFILKFDNIGERLWATYYGGSDGDGGVSVTANASGNLFITGETFSRDFPTYNPGGGAYYQEANAGGVDVFILKFEGFDVGVSEDRQLHNNLEVKTIHVPIFFNSEIVLKFDGFLREFPLRICLYNSEGKAIIEKSYTLISNSLVVRDERMSNLAKGLYILLIYHGEREIARFKLLKRP